MTEKAIDEAFLKDLLATVRHEDRVSRERQGTSKAAGRDDFAAYHGGKAEAYQHVGRILAAVLAGTEIPQGALVTEADP